MTLGVKYLSSLDQIPEDRLRRYKDAGWTEESGVTEAGDPYRSFTHPSGDWMEHWNVIDGHLQRMCFNPNQTIKLKSTKD